MIAFGNLRGSRTFWELSSGGDHEVLAPADLHQLQWISIRVSKEGNTSTPGSVVRFLAKLNAAFAQGPERLVNIPHHEVHTGPPFRWSRRCPRNQTDLHPAAVETGIVVRVVILLGQAQDVLVKINGPFQIRYPQGYIPYSNMLHLRDLWENIECADQIWSRGVLNIYRPHARISVCNVRMISGHMDAFYPVQEIHFT
jgi:hypothetical protein